MENGSKSQTAKQKTDLRYEIFAREYVLDLNGTRAAIAAGYSEKGAEAAASRLLRNVKVHKLIADLSSHRAKKLDITAEYVLGKVKQTIERCSQGVEVVDREGNPTGVWKEDSFAVLKGCELLGKHLKLFTDKLEINDSQGIVRKLHEGRERVSKMKK